MRELPTWASLWVVLLPACTAGSADEVGQKRSRDPSPTSLDAAANTTPDGLAPDGSVAGAKQPGTGEADAGTTLGTESPTRRKARALLAAVDERMHYGFEEDERLAHLSRAAGHAGIGLCHCFGQEEGHQPVQPTGYYSDDIYSLAGCAQDEAYTVFRELPIRSVDAMQCVMTEVAPASFADFVVCSSEVLERHLECLLDFDEADMCSGSFEERHSACRPSFDGCPNLELVREAVRSCGENPFVYCGEAQVVGGARCNGWDDCADASDETCGYATEPMRCGQGWIAPWVICDGQADCNGATDEQHCEELGNRVERHMKLSPEDERQWRIQNIRQRMTGTDQPELQGLQRGLLWQWASQLPGTATLQPSDCYSTGCTPTVLKLGDLPADTSLADIPAPDFGAWSGFVAFDDWRRSGSSAELTVGFWTGTESEVADWLSPRQGVAARLRGEAETSSSELTVQLEQWLAAVPWPFTPSPPDFVVDCRESGCLLRFAEDGKSYTWFQQLEAAGLLRADEFLLLGGSGGVTAWWITKPPGTEADPERATNQGGLFGYFRPAPAVTRSLTWLPSSNV